jgi:hypothetical protein
VRGCNANKNVWAVGQSHGYGHAMQERQRSVLTNQCLGKDTNAEPPGRGTEESFLTDSDEFIVERHCTSHVCGSPKITMHMRHGRKFKLILSISLSIYPSA